MDGVVHVDEVPGLLAVAEDRRRPPGQHPRREDRDYPRLAEWILARAVDIRQGQRGKVQSTSALVETQIVEGDGLGDPVRRDRPGPVAGTLLDRDALRLAVERAPRG